MIIFLRTVFLLVLILILPTALFAQSSNTAVCGDGYCSSGEADMYECPSCVYETPSCGMPCTSKPGTCPQDCMALDLCGDGICNADFEAPQTCSQDCGPLPAICGDGVCQETEINTCIQDCLAIIDDWDSWGDFCRQFPESSHCPPLCGNGVVDSGEE